VIHYETKDGAPVIRKGNALLAAELPGELAMYAAWALEALRRPMFDRIGYLGGGTAVMPRLLQTRALLHDVFEIEPTICGRLRLLYPWLQVICGDWRETIGGRRYNALVYDIPGPVPRAELEADYLLPGGILFCST
jgi:hypothetical protein